MLIASARWRIKQAVMGRAASYDLSAQQFWFLIAIQERPGVSQVQLASRARADAPTASRVVFNLVRRGLVHTEPDPDDRRRSRLFLTTTGERLARDLSVIAQEIRAAIVAGMTEAQVNALREGLQHVIANMDRFNAAGRNGETAPPLPPSDEAAARSAGRRPTAPRPNASHSRARAVVRSHPNGSRRQRGS